MFSWYNDQALAHFRQIHRGTVGTLWPHIWQDTPTNLCSQRDSRDEDCKEAARQEEETTDILDGCGWPAEAESE